MVQLAVSPLSRRRAIGRQLQLAAEDIVDASAQRRPLALVDVEVPSEIEQSALTHFVAEAFGAHEAMGETGLALVTYLGHVDPVSTYWYLEASPVLLRGIAEAAEQTFTTGGGHD